MGNCCVRGGQMDSRKYERIPVTQAVRLVCEGRVVSTSEVVDISKGGLGIKSSAQRLNSGQIVDVDFYKPGHPRGISCCMRAMVVHAGPQTTGLMFAENSNFQNDIQKY